MSCTATSSDGEGGGGGHGGSKEGGDDGNGGAPGGGAGAGRSGSGAKIGGSGGSSPGGGNNPSEGTASLRFCNGLVGEGGSAAVELSIGKVTTSAAPGECAMVCASVPAGLGRPVLRRNGKELPHNEEFAFRADQHVGLVALLDAKTRLVTLAGGQLPSDVACEDFNPFTGDTTSSGPKTYGKFCRENDGPAVDLELFVGNLSLKADPGECSTTREELCPIIPAGNQTLKLVVSGHVVAKRDVFLDPTREYLFGVDVDESLTMTIITVEALGDKSCMAAGIPPPPPEGTPSVLKFCNGLPSGVAELTLPDGVKLKADPGRCAPTKGMPCSKMASGEATVAVSLDGKSIGEGEPDIPPGAELVLRLYLEAGERYLQLTSVPKSTTCSQYEWK